MTELQPARFQGNLLGFFSVLIWSTTLAFSWRLAEELGTITSGAYLYFAAGIISVGYFIYKHKGSGFRELARLPRRYFWVCGGLFVLYEFFLYLAIYFAVSRQQALEVGLINYSWIGFTLLLSVPILKKKARPLLVPGIVIAFAGIVLATVQPGAFSWSEFKANQVLHAGPNILALCAAVIWGLYSNLSRLWAQNTTVSAAPFFILVTGISLLVFSLFIHEETRWSLATGMEFAYTALFPCMLAYIFWDVAMRKGNMVLIASLSYLIPLLSTIISSLYLQVPMNNNIILACVLVVAGAAVCRISVKESANDELRSAN